MTRRSSEATCGELEMHLVTEEVQTRCRDGVNVGTSDIMVKSPKYDRLMSWTVFDEELEAMANHNRLAAQKKATHLLVILQGQAADVIHNVQVIVTYKDIVGGLKDWYENLLAAT
jgi:hypothetical protein